MNHLPAIHMQMRQKPGVLPVASDVVHKTYLRIHWALSHTFTAFHSHPTGHGPIFFRLLDVKNGDCSSPNHVSESQNEDVCNLFHIFSIQKEQQKVIESDMK